MRGHEKANICSDSRGREINDAGGREKGRPLEDTEQIKIKVPPEEIVFLDQLFKSYEGLAMVTVNRKEKGILLLDVSRGTKADVLDILRDLQQKIPLKILKN